MDKLKQDESQWRQRNTEIREWLLTHPHRVEDGLWHAAINLTEVLEEELNREIKNTRSAKRASLLSPLKDLFVSIIPHFNRKVVAKT